MLSHWWLFISTARLEKKKKLKKTPRKKEEETPPPAGWDPGGSFSTFFVSSGYLLSCPLACNHRHFPGRRFRFFISAAKKKTNTKNKTSRAVLFSLASSFRRGLFFVSLFFWRPWLDCLVSVIDAGIDAERFVFTPFSLFGFLKRSIFVLTQFFAIPQDVNGIIALPMGITGE